MFSWVSSWFMSRPPVAPGPLVGPARNAPNNGHNIKSFIEEHNSKLQTLETTKTQTTQKSTAAPVQIIVASSDDIKHTLSNLRQTSLTKLDAGSQDPPLLKEMQSVLKHGPSRYFEEVKQRREKNKAIQLEKELEEGTTELKTAKLAEQAELEKCQANLERLESEFLISEAELADFEQAMNDFDKMVTDGLKQTEDTIKDEFRALAFETGLDFYNAVSDKVKEDKSTLKLSEPKRDPCAELQALAEELEKEAAKAADEVVALGESIKSKNLRTMSLESFPIY